MNHLKQFTRRLREVDPKSRERDGVKSMSSESHDYGLPNHNVKLIGLGQEHQRLLDAKQFPCVKIRDKKRLH